MTICRESEFLERNTMNKLIRDLISFPGDEQIESDDLVTRILAAGESAQSQLMYVSNAQELLSRLTSEGYELATVTPDVVCYKTFTTERSTSSANSVVGTMSQNCNPELS
jgi:hypothetical protein